jgi:hypothetical protein
VSTSSTDQALIDCLPAEKRRLLGEVDRLQAAIAEEADRGEWTHAAELESERAPLLRQIYQGLDELNAEQGEALARLTRRLIEDDRGLVERVAAERDRLGLELGSLRRGQRAVGEYARHAGR